MKKLPRNVLLLVGLLLCCSAIAEEWCDDFSNAVNSEMVWYGDWKHFAINKQGQLQSQATEATESVLFHESIAAINAEWQFWVRISGTCSAYNLIRFYIALEEEDVTSNGFFVQVGGANKNITLYQQKNGDAKKIIEDTTRKKILDSGASYLHVRVTRSDNGIMRLYSQVEGKDSAWNTEGEYFTPMLTSHYSAICVKNSKKRGYDFYVDDICVSGEVQHTSLENENIEGTETKIHLQTESISPNGDGWEDEACITYQSPYLKNTAQLSIYTANGILVKKLAPITSSSDGMICWDGRNMDGNLVDIGVYVMHIEITSPNAPTIRQRYAIAVVR